MSTDATNPADGELAPEAEVEIEDGQTVETETPELDEDGNPVEASEEDEDTEEIEHDGQKYALPKALKPALLMQADYTKKTQELAEQRKGLDEQRAKLDASLATAAEAEEAIVDARASVKAIDSQAAELKTAISAVETELANVDWTALSRMEGGEAAYRQREQYLRQLRLAQDQLGEQRTKLTGDLDAKVKARNDARSERALEQQQATAKLIEDRDAALKAEFPKWSEEFPEVQAFAAKHLGVPADVVAATTDPRLLKGLRYAKLGFDAEQRARTAKAATTRVQPAAQGGAPIRKVAGVSVPQTDPNRLSTDAWMKHRNGQISQKGRR
jgi:predicted  nucleic acid-binding Zn-ribbon protein